MNAHAMYDASVEQVGGNVVFQILHVEVRDATPPAVDPSAEIDYEELADQDVVAVRAVGFLFGVTDVGHSIVVKVTGFKPSFYVKLSDGATEYHAAEVGRQVELVCRLKPRSVKPTFVTKPEMYGWTSDPLNPLKRKQFCWARLEFETCKAARNATFNLEKHAVDPGDMGGHRILDMGSQRVDFTQQLMAACNIRASGWAQLNTFTAAMPTSRIAPFVQRELYTLLTQITPRDDLSAVSRIVFTCTDIETDSATGAMSHAVCTPKCPRGCTGDAVIFIGISVWAYDSAFKPLARYMLCLGDVAPVPDMIVKCYPTEMDLLLAWRDHIVSIDSDWEVSYNGSGFDYKYLSDRYMRLKRSYTRFLHLGKMVADECPIQEKRLQSNAYGDNTLSTFQMKGRVVSDLFLYSKVNFKMTSYKLDVMAKAYIKDTAGKVVLSVPGWIEDSMAAVRQALLTLVPPDHEAVTALDQIPVVAASETADELVILDESDEEVDDKKEDVEHPYNALLRKSAAALTAAQSTPLLKEAFKQALTATGSDNYKKLHAINRMNAAARSAIAQYAMVDCDLTLQLMHAISAVPNMVQMSCVTHTLLMDIANRGQQIKVYNQLYRFGSDFVMNAPCSGWPEGCEYEGAHVIPPVPGFYQDPVVVLDFASLYPSIMQAKNLCFSTLCAVPPPPELRTDAYEISGRTYTFQRHERGVMPKILDGLLDARKATKNAMKGLSKSSLEYALLDGKQLALKVSANSCYGFLGVQTNGMYACVPAAAAVTMTGRGMIKRTQEYVISKGAVVIYGDTDSIMFTLPGVPRDEVFIKGPELAKGASALFEKPIKLEFEKVMEQYMLLKKKNYAGMMRTCIEDKGKLMAKGIASERRDNCSLVRTTMKKVLGAVMVDGDPNKAFGIVKSVLDNLKSNTISIEELGITMSLKPEDSYVDPNGHAQLNVVKKMIARGAFNVPRPGDRVEYVIVESHAEKVSDRAEDPLFVVKNNIKLDRLYYLNNQLRTPILKIMEVLPVPSVKKLFEAAEADLGRQRLGVGRVTDFFASVAPPSTTDMPPRSYTLKSLALPLPSPKPAKKQKLVQSNLTF